MTILRDDFPVTRRWAFLDHAAVAPLPECARRALHACADDYADNGVTCEPRWLDRIEHVRRNSAHLLNADPLDVAFVKNTSDGISIVAEGYPWCDGDNVVIAEDEYPANVYPWMNLASRGVEVRRVASRGPRIHIDDLRSAMDSRTRIVSLSWVEFATGYRNDLDAVGQLCRERGAYFFVDAIQGLGLLPLDVRAAPIDFLAADGHKWLLGPDGCGLFWLRRELLDVLRPVSLGWNSVVGAWDFSRIDFTLKPHAGRYEGGSYNVAGIMALGASVELLLETGIPAVWSAVEALTDRLCRGATALGHKVFSGRGDGERSGIVSLVVPEARAVMKRCREAGIVVNVRAGRLRVSPHFYNSADEIDRLLDVLRQLKQ